MDENEQNQNDKVLQIKIENDGPTDWKVVAGHALFGVGMSALSILFAGFVRGRTIRQANITLAAMVQQKNEEDEA